MTTPAATPLLRLSFPVLLVVLSLLALWLHTQPTPPQRAAVLTHFRAGARSQTGDVATGAAATAGAVATQAQRLSPTRAAAVAAANRTTNKPPALAPATAPPRLTPAQVLGSPRTPGYVPAECRAVQRAPFMAVGWVFQLEGAGASITLGDAYRKVYERWVTRAAHGNQPRFVGFKADGSGIGNHMRALVLVLTVAILSDRVMFINDDMFSRYFDPPPGIEWTPSGLARVFPQAGASQLTSAYALNLGDDTYACACLLGNIGAVLDADARTVHAVAHNAGVSGFFTYLLVNPATRLSPLTCFNQGIHLCFEEAIKFVLAKPRDDLLQFVATTQQNFGLTRRATVAVATRTFFDFEPTHKHYLAHMNEYFDRLCQELERLQPELPGQWIIFYTSDDATFKREAAARLGRFGRVVVPPGGPQHTASQRGFSADLADWFVISEAQVAITSGTTFHSSARFRSAQPGHRTGTLIMGLNQPLTFSWLPRTLQEIQNFCTQRKDCENLAQYSRLHLFDMHF